MGKLKKQLDKGVAYLKRNGIRKTVHRTVRKLILSSDVDYETWLKKHSADEEEKKRQRASYTADDPLVIVHLIPDEASMRSVRRQTYGMLAAGKEKNPDTFHLLLTNQARLTEDAVYELVREAKEYPQADLFYADDDIFSEKQFREPFCKPEFDDCLYRQWDYLGDVLFFRGSLAERLEDINCREEIIAKAEQIRRVPKILCHTDGRYRKVRKKELIPEEVPLPEVTVIIPNKDHTGELKNCIESLSEKGGYENLKICIVENNSEEEETFVYYRQLTETDRRVSILNYEGPFNYSRINNTAAAQTKSEYLLFLNNDTVVKSEGFLAELMKWATLPETGVVGARLLFEDETIQHAGVVLGYGGIAGHAFEGMNNEQYESTVYAGVVRRMSAVTAACVLVRRSVFEEAGGFEESLEVAYNDIDLCMKIGGNGWQVLYDPYAQMYHLESQTRGLEMTEEKAQRVQREADLFVSRWKDEIEAGDRWYHPNLTLEKPDFSLKR